MVGTFLGHRVDKYTVGCHIHMTLDALQTEILVTSARSNLKGKYNYSTFCFTLLELVLCDRKYRRKKLSFCNNV